MQKKSLKHTLGLLIICIISIYGTFLCMRGIIRKEYFGSGETGRPFELYGVAAIASNIILMLTFLICCVLAITYYFSDTKKK